MGSYGGFGRLSRSIIEMLADNVALREFISRDEALMRVRVALIAHPLKQTAMNGLAALKRIRADHIKSRPLVGEVLMAEQGGDFRSGGSSQEI